MMKKSAIFATAAFALMGSVSANAADLNGGSIKDHGYSAPALQSAARRIYLRGDYSFANQDMGSVYEPPAYTLSDTSISRTHGFGGGVGMYYGSNVRLDFTYDVRNEADFRGSVIDGAATVQGERRFGIKSNVALFNVYYDFDAHARIKPYLGVGLGFSHNKTTAGTIVTGCPIACTAEIDGASQYSAAGAIMAGFTAKLHDRLSLDLGYRFLYLGDAHTGDIRITTGGPGPTTAPDPIVHDLTAHELRVGMRWDIR